MNSFIKRYFYKRKVSQLVKSGVVPLTDIALSDEKACVICVAALMYLCEVKKKARLVIDSAGGLVNHGFAIIDTVKRYSEKITIECNNEASGMSFLILISGHPGNRQVSSMCSLVFTPINNGPKFDNDKEALPEIERIHNEIIAIVTLPGHCSESEVKDWLRTGMTFTPKQAKDLGFIDVIHGSI